MSTLLEISQKFKTIDIWSIVKKVILNHKDEIIKLNQSQLWDGKTKQDNDIKPLYSQDPYFKTQAQAEGYKKWKQKITPNSRRNPDAPNLYINGYFHSLIDIVDKGSYLEIGAQNPQNVFGGDLDQKFKNIYGLNDANWKLIKTKLLPEVLQGIKNHFKI